MTFLGKDKWIQSSCEVILVNQIVAIVKLLVLNSANVQVNLRRSSTSQLHRSDNPCLPCRHCQSIANHQHEWRRHTGECLLSHATCISKDLVSWKLLGFLQQHVKFDPPSSRGILQAVHSLDQCKYMSYFTASLQHRKC